MLTIENLHASYSQRVVLQGIDLQVKAGEVVTLCGRGGSGRSTLLKVLMGVHPLDSGTILYEGELGFCSISAYPAFSRARLGIVWLPETKALFTDLTAEENLLLALKAFGGFLQKSWRGELYAIYERYPILATRARVAAGVLSGGEQQLLAFARSMIVAGKARFFLLDEPAEGLAETWVKEVSEHLEELKNEGKAIVMIEEKMQISQVLGARAFNLNR